MCALEYRGVTVDPNMLRSSDGAQAAFPATEWPLGFNILYGMDSLSEVDLTAFCNGFRHRVFCSAYTTSLLPLTTFCLRFLFQIALTT